MENKCYFCCHHGPDNSFLDKDAKAKIKRLEQEVARLREALVKIRDLEVHHSHPTICNIEECYCPMTIAKEALGGGDRPVSQIERDIEYLKDDFPYISKKCGQETVDRIKRLICILKKHHDVGLTGLIHLWGKVCPICEGQDVKHG